MEIKMKSHALIFLCGMFFAMSCHTTVKVGPPEIKLRTAKKEAGKEHEVFFSFPSPRTSHPPGYIFRTSVNKSNIHVTTLSDSVMIAKTLVTNEEFADEVYEVSSEYVANVLGLKVGSVVANRKRKYKVEFKLEKAERESIEELVLDELVKKKNLNFKPNEDYYIITTAIKAKVVKFIFSDYRSVDLDIKAQIDTLNIQGKISKTGDNKVVISKEFDVPHRLFYITAKINSSGVLSQESNQIMLEPSKKGIIKE